MLIYRKQDLTEDGVPVEFEDVNETLAFFFEHHKIRVSILEDSRRFALFADMGIVNDDGGIEELRVLSRGRSLNATLKELRLVCELEQAWLANMKKLEVESD